MSTSIVLPASEEDILFSFIANLHETQAFALLLGNEEKPLEELNTTMVMPSLEKLTIGNEVQYAIFQQSLLVHSNITYLNIQIAANVTFEFSIECIRKHGQNQEM